MKIIIKTMETPEEIEGKSLVHWQTWREAYDDLLPADFQETMTLEKCRFFSQKYPENTLIAMDGKKVVGFISYGNFRDEAIQAGEIIALYVLKDYYGKGVSEQLMHAAFDSDKRSLSNVSCQSIAFAFIDHASAFLRSISRAMEAYFSASALLPAF